MTDRKPPAAESANRVLIEACVSSLEDAVAAAEAGADRLELCAALEVGGLTPSIGLIEQVVSAVAIPVMVMIRPRVGDFSLSESDLATAIGDVKAAQRAGAEGVVFGLLDSEGVIDAPCTRRLVEAADHLQTVFHRAVDFTPDPVAAVDTLADLGLTRVLTSGGAPRAMDALDVIGQMVKRSQGRIQILPGGGVRAGNVSRVVAETGCDQVHLGPSIAVRSGTLRGLQLSDIGLLSANGYRVLDAPAVRSAVRAAADASRVFSQADGAPNRHPSRDHQ